MGRARERRTGEFATESICIPFCVSGVLGSRIKRSKSLCFLVADSIVWRLCWPDSEYLLFPQQFLWQMGCLSRLVAVYHVSVGTVSLLNTDAVVNFLSVTLRMVHMIPNQEKSQYMMECLLFRRTMQSDFGQKHRIVVYSHGV